MFYLKYLTGSGCSNKSVDKIQVAMGPGTNDVDFENTSGSVAKCPS